MSRFRNDEPGAPAGVRGSKRPADWCGVFKSIEEVPARYRLAAFRDSFRGRDVWGEWMEAENDSLASSTREYYARLERRWKDHMGHRSRHHALADPEHVESFLAEYRADRTPETMYSSFYAPLNRFYEWLMYHTDTPHRYSPVYLAAVAGGVTAELWAHKNAKVEARYERAKGNGRDS